MRAQRAGRIVNVSSVSGKIGEPFASWYHASKHALVGLSDSLRMELHPFGIDVVIIEPGPTRTEWGGIARGSLTRYSGEGPYRDGARAHLQMLNAVAEGSMPSLASKVAAMCLTSHEKVVREGGLSQEQVQAAVRIAAVVHAVAAVLDGEDALR